MPETNVQEPKTTFAENLAYYRRIAGFTQLQVAQMLNIHRTTYTKYETGDSEPNVENLVRISKILNISLDLLLGARTEDDLIAENGDPARLDSEKTNLLNNYSSLSREDREEVVRLIMHLKR